MGVVEASIREDVCESAGAVECRVQRAVGVVLGDGEQVNVAIHPSSFYDLAVNRVDGQPLSNTARTSVARYIRGNVAGPIKGRIGGAGGRETGNQEHAVSRSPSDDVPGTINCEACEGIT